jgi:hypothetical protein
MDRRLRALAQVEARELKSLETDLVKEQRVKTRARGGGNRMPALTLELKPPGRRDAAFKTRNRHGSRAALEEAEKTPPETPKETLVLTRGLYAPPRMAALADRRRYRRVFGWRQADRPRPNRAARSANAAATC